MAEVGRYWDGKEWQIKTMSRSIMGPDPKCNFCGEEPTAYWFSGSGGLEICSHCAVDKLPLVIADAIAGNHRANALNSAIFESAIEKIVSAYWRGAAIALSRRTHPDFREDDAPNEPEDIEFNDEATS